MIEQVPQDMIEHNAETEAARQAEGAATERRGVTIRDEITADLVARGYTEVAIASDTAPDSTSEGSRFGSGKVCAVEPGPRAIRQNARYVSGKGYVLPGEEPK